MTDPAPANYGLEELIAAAEAGDLGNFLKGAHGNLEGDAWNDLVNETVTAEAEGRLDLMAALGGLSQVSYVIWEFLQDLIPKLPLTLGGLLAVFLRLEELATGQEMAWRRGKLFEDWCQAEADRPRISIEAIMNGDAPAELLRPALFAALKVDQERYFPSLLRLLQNEEQAYRDEAAWAIGRSLLSEPNLVIAVGELERSLVDTEGAIHAASLGALISIGVRNSQFEAAAQAAARRAKPLSERGVRSAAARELLGKIENVGEPLMQAVFDLLVETNADEDEAIEAIDMIVGHGLDKSYASRVEALLDQLLGEQGIKLKKLDSACNAILTGNQKLRDNTIVRWLADGGDAMIRAIHDLIATSHGEALRFDLNFSAAGLTPEQATGLARRLCEALLIYPTTLASILVSLIATGPVEAAPTIERLLFDPLLANYWVGPRKYLEEAAATATPRVAAAIGRVLVGHAQYSAAIEAADPIPELWPSEKHRFLIALKDSEERRAIARAAESQSVIMSLFSKSVILYGNAAIVGVHVEPGKVVRQESTMQTMEYSQELPRLEIIDPVGQFYRRNKLANGRDD